jgi:hypothetical protein
VENKTVTLGYAEHERLLNLETNHRTIVADMEANHKAELKGMEVKHQAELDIICEGGGIQILTEPNRFSPWGYDSKIIKYSKAEVREQLDAGIAEVAKYRVIIAKLLSRGLAERIINKQVEY